MPYVVFVACCLIWGSTSLAIRTGDEAVPPLRAATLIVHTIDVLGVDLGAPRERPHGGRGRKRA